MPGSRARRASRSRSWPYPPATTDSRAIGNEVFAHADGLSIDPTKPATIRLRFSQPDVMSTPLNQVQVGHVSDAGVMTKAPDCLGQDLPPGATYCIVRPVTRTAHNTNVAIRTIETSRWRLRRTGPNESLAQTGPTAPQGVKTALAAPFDGSAVRISWKAPASDGGAAATGYRVYRDGALVATTDLAASSYVVKNPGPGTHTLAVTAVNGISEGVAGAASISVAKLSKPRKVVAPRGDAGGKLKAGARWKAPVAAGGSAITKYKVAVFKKNGTKVDTKVVKAGKAEATSSS